MRVHFTPEYFIRDEPSLQAPNTKPNVGSRGLTLEFGACVSAVLTGALSVRPRAHPGISLCHNHIDLIIVHQPRR